VHDVDLLPEGAAVRVDGWLGLVSVNGAKCGDSSP
jgi:hypothetical protein